MQISNLKDLDPSSAPIAEPKPTENKNSVITKLTPGVHDPNRVNVFIDGNFEFSLNLAQIVDFKLKIGKHVTTKELKDLRAASEFGKLYQSTLEWILARPRSIYETRDHLKKKLEKRKLTNRRIAEQRERKNEINCYGHKAPKQDDKNVYDDDNGFFSNTAKYRKPHLPSKELPLFTEEDIEAVIERLKSRKYLDDERFARYFLENRNITKGASVKKLRLDLSRKGIDKKLIDNLMAEEIRTDDEEIKKIIAKKAKKYDKDKLIAYLVRHGFDYQLARDAVAGTDLQSSV